MTTYYWIGTTSTDANNGANWSLSSGGSAAGALPGAGDTIIYDSNGFDKTISAVDETNNQFTSSSHGFITNQPVWITSTNVVPTPLSARTTYYIIRTDANIVQLATAAAGAAIDITDSGEGTLKIRPVYNCTMDTRAVNIVDVKSEYAGTLTIDGSATLTVSEGMSLNGNIDAGSNATILFSGAAPASYNSFMVLNGQYANISNPANLAYAYSNTENPTKFDDGPYPKVTLAAAVVYSPERDAPTSTTFDDYDDGVATMYSLTIGGSASFKPNSASTNAQDDRPKEFKITSDGGFACSVASFDAGFATFDFQAAGGSGFAVPVTGSPSYGDALTPFKCKIRNLKFHADTAGDFVAFAEGSVVICESLEVGDGCVLKGPAVATSTYGAEIHAVKPPIIKGSWDFSQVSPGVYRSPVTLMPTIQYQGISSTPNATVHIADGTTVTLSQSTWAKVTGWVSTTPAHEHDLDIDTTNDKFTAPETGAYLSLIHI